MAGKTGRLRFLERLLAATVAGGTAAVLWQGLSRALLPYQLNYAEGILLNASVLASRGEALYPLPDAPPYIFNQYGPVMYYVVGAFVDPSHVSFTPGRLLVCMAGLVVAGLLSLLLWRWSRSWQVGLIFGFLFLTLPLGRDWLGLLRADLVALALSLAGLCVFALLPRAWYWSIPLFAAALAVKYSLVAAPAACWLWLLRQRDLKKAAGFAAGLGLLGVGIFLWTQQATGGGFFFHMFGTHAAPFSWLRLAVFFFATLVIHSPLLLLLIPLGDSAPSSRALPLLYLGLSTLTGLGIGRGGFDLNHLLEWSAALCLCAGLGYAQWRREAQYARPALISLALTLALAAGSAAAGFRGQPERAECPALYDYVKSHPGERMLSEEVGVLVLAGKRVYLSDPYVYTQLVERAGWSAEALNRQLREAHFDAVILDEDVPSLRESRRPTLRPARRWPLAFLDTLEETYRPTRRFLCKDAGVVYEPKERAGED